MRNDRLSSSTSFWQSSLWEEILRESGQVSDVEVISFGPHAILVEYRNIGMGFLGAFSLGVEGGMYTRDFMDRVCGEIYAHGAIFWQIEEYNPKGIDQASTKIQTYGKSFIEPWTRTIDLSRTEEEILTDMHEKGRYNIRVALKRGITTAWVTPTAENIDIWMNLLSETTERDDFSHNSREYYTAFLRNIHDANAGGMIFASLEGRVISAGIFVFFHGIAIYYYGASTSDAEMRKHMAPYLLQWEGIREGKLRGCQVYDFLGVSPPEEPSHHLAGVSNFKEKFGGNIIGIGSKTFFILSYWKYYLFSFIRYLKKTFKK